MQLQSSDVAEDLSSCAMLSTLSCKANEREKNFGVFAELPSLGLFIVALHVIFSQIFFRGKRRKTCS